MRNIWKVILAAVFAIAGVFAGTQAANASTVASIANLYTPHDYGVYHGGINWDGSSFAQEDGGEVCDLVADGHGPYFHMIAATDKGSLQFAYQHEIDGTGGCNSINGGDHEASGLGNVYFVDVWNCNGGTISGSSTESGCYGRRYWNPYIYSGRASESLGTTTGAIY